MRFVWPSLVAATVLGSLPAWPFAHAQVGSVIENVELATVDGRKHALLSNATANVFLFFKPGQEHSRAVLQQVAVCARDLSTQSVHWVAVVSSRFSRTEIDAEVRETGIRMPVLIDDGDALYGRLGVALVPVTGITDRDHRLVAYQPFTKINYVEVVRARIRHLLKEISDAELAQVLNPPKATQGGDVEVAHRRLKLAEKLWRAGNAATAQENVRQSIAKDPTFAPAHALLGKILTAQGRWADAVDAFEQALKLDPANALAREALEADLTTLRLKQADRTATEEERLRLSRLQRVLGRQEHSRDEPPPQPPGVAPPAGTAPPPGEK
jgi:hypothetical protein